DGDVTFDQQLVRRLVKIHARDRVAEHVATPLHDTLRPGAQRQPFHPQIVPLARPDHQPVLTKPNRTIIPIMGPMNDPQPTHTSPLNGASPRGSRQTWNRVDWRQPQMNADARRYWSETIGVPGTHGHKRTRKVLLPRRPGLDESVVRCVTVRNLRPSAFICGLKTLHKLRAFRRGVGAFG